LININNEKKGTTYPTTYPFSQFEKKSGTTSCLYCRNFFDEIFEWLTIELEK